MNKIPSGPIYEIISSPAPPHKKELEELRRSAPHSDRKRRDLSRPQEPGRGKSYESSPRDTNSLEEKKKWWSIFTGE